MEFKGTKGKWKTDLREIKNEKGKIICDVWDMDTRIFPNRIESEANALVISKAPELLAELKIAVKALKAVYSFGASKPIIDRWEQLIKEATEL